MPTLTVDKVKEKTARAKKRVAGKEGAALRKANKTVRRFLREGIMRHALVLTSFQLIELRGLL